MNNLDTNTKRQGTVTLKDLMSRGYQQLLHHAYPDHASLPHYSRFGTWTRISSFFLPPLGLDPILIGEIRIR